MPGSGLYRQANFRWRGGMISVNNWQTGRVHIQGRGAGDLARRLSTSTQSFLFIPILSTANVSIGRNKSPFHVEEPTAVSLMAPRVAFVSPSLCGGQLLPFPLLETSFLAPHTNNTNLSGELAHKAAARRGARPRYVATALLVHGRDQTCWSRCQSGLQATLWHSRPILRCGFAVFFAIALSDFCKPLLRVYSISHLVAGCCPVPSTVWLLRRLRSLWRVFVAWVGIASCFGDFPRGVGTTCFTCVFLLSGLIQCCLLASGYEASRPAFAVLFPWFQTGLRTLISQDGTTSRIARDVSHFEFPGRVFLRLSTAGPLIHFTKFGSSFVTLFVLLSAALALAAHGLSRFLLWSLFDSPSACVCSTFLHSFPAPILWQIGFAGVRVGEASHLGPAPLTTEGASAAPEPGSSLLCRCSNAFNTVHRSAVLQSIRTMGGLLISPRQSSFHGLQRCL